ncbi:MAG: metallophosphatase family protein [Anaerolineae bacterium]|jgi:diadenosine tetraphosphatase ApaH/serine/threonine PP2A family protein phosphatase|nr:metallophosphatase family protein [Anaerolineae bacterium]
MRILVISDIHANYTAFETVLKDAQGMWDYVWCLGDVVGYGPDPNDCVEKLRELPHLCLAGNHDWAALDRLDIRTFNPDARRAVDWTRETLTSDNTHWLEALPVTFVIGDYTLAHASPREPIWEYILETKTASDNFPHFETPYCLVGHTHQPVIYEQVTEYDTTATRPNYGKQRHLNGRRQIINPGSVGQPRDTDPRAAYALLDFEKNIWEHRRVPYDVSSVQRRMRQYRMPERLIARLEMGM